MGDCLGGALGGSPAKTLGGPGQILGTFSGDCFGGVSRGGHAKSLASPVQILGGILGQLSRGSPWGIRANRPGDSGKLLREFFARFAKSSGVLTKSWGQFWATARGSRWGSHANCLGHFGHFLGNSLGEIRKIFGGTWPIPGGQLRRLSRGAHGEVLGSNGQILAKS